MNEQIKLIQQYLNLKVDGDFGPITTNAVSVKLNVYNNIKNIQKAVGVTVDGELGPITIRAIFDKFGLKEEPSDNKLIDIFKKEIGIHEDSRNHGDGISKYWTATNYPEGYANREPYCAACVTWCIKQLETFSETERPKTASAFGYENWAENLPKKVKLIRKPKSVKRGQLVIFSFSHIGIATSDSNTNGFFDTIEANTGASGSRDGDGVYAKTRHMDVVRSVITINQTNP